jgi:hypothetical protein
MVTNTAGKPSVGTATRFAYAAGATGILANLFLIAMYVRLGLRAGGPEARDLAQLRRRSGGLGQRSGGIALGRVHDPRGARPGRAPAAATGGARLMQAAGLAAMALLTVGGPLLVLGVLAFEVETPIAMASWIVLCLWLLLVNRWLRLSGALRPRVARLREVLGAGVLVGYVAVGLELLLPWMSWPQLVVLGVGVLIGLPAYLGIPVWFVLLGRHLAP